MECTPEQARAEIDRLTEALRNEEVATVLVEMSIDLMQPVALIIAEAMTHYTALSQKQRARHDYAPRPACPIHCLLDEPTYNRFITNANQLKMSPENYAFFCIKRYLLIDEKLVVVECKSGPRTKTKRIRAQEPEG